jgi:hypothetical protein
MSRPVASGDLAEFTAQLEGVEDVNALDEHSWTLLNWAAGCGALPFVRVLVDRGADVFKRGHDRRTPYLIALAAGHAETAAFLKDAEASHGGDTDATSSRRAQRRVYCRAYVLRSLRRSAAWSEPRAEGRDELTDDDVVFLHQDFSVTRSVLHGKDVLFGTPSAEWRVFCTDVLGFRVPSDEDLMLASTANATSSGATPVSPENRDSASRPDTVA